MIAIVILIYPLNNRNGVIFPEIKYVKCNKGVLNWLNKADSD